MSTRANFPPPPDAEESMRIAEHIHTMAETLVDDPDRAANMIEEWVIDQPTPVADLRLHYIAICGPIIAATYMQQAAQPEPGDVFALDRLPGTPEDPARDTIAQALTCYLNGEATTAQDVISAAITVGGRAALLDLGVESLKLLASTLKGKRDGSL